MQRTNPGRVALTSSLALLLGAGVPLQQIAAQERPADPAATPVSRGHALVQSQGFQMVPGPAPKDVLRSPTPETPGANGFQMLPSSADAAASQASAKVVSPSAALVSDPSGFQMLPAAATALSVSSPQPLALQADAKAKPVRTGLPVVQADPEPASVTENGFAMLPAASGRPESVSFAAAPAVAPATLAAARAPAPSGDFATAPVATVQAPIAVAAEHAPALAAQVSLPTVEAATPEAELLLVSAPDASPAPVQTKRALLAVAAPAAVATDLRPQAAMARRHAAPTAQFVASATTQRAPAPVLVSLSQPISVSAEVAPVLDRKAPTRRLRRKLPVAVLTPAKVDARQHLQLASASPLFLESFDQPVDTGFRTLSAAPAAPEAVVVESEAAPPSPVFETATAVRTEAAAPARLAFASYDAPVATVPQLQRLASAAPDLILTSANPTLAASADATATPASAVAETSPALSRRADDQVIMLAQAAPPPATAPAPPPEPAAAPVAPPAPAGAPAPSAAASGAPVAPAAPPAPPPAPVVQRIIVQGNERIEASTILSYLPIQVGDQVDSARLDLAVKTIYRTDLFADVSMEMQGSDLVVRVSENPIINQVVFEGNHALKEDKLRDEVTVRPRGIFTRSKVEQDAQKIIELYRRSGRISATVTPKIVQLPQKRVDLIFEINEGPKSGIVHINFVGNKSFSDNALRDVVVTRESHWYKFFQSNDNYDPDRIEYDREQLRKFYRNHGYYDFRVVSGVAELAPDKNGFVVTFTVDEGPRYHFGKLKVTTELKRLNGELLQALLPVRSGELYQDDRIEKATDALTYAAGANGFAFVDVRPRYVAHPETRTVDVDFDIKEGPRVYIERIDIVGNSRTLDYVIRREMRVAEGDAYNRVLVDRSKQQIRALGFFKDVDIEQVAGSAPDKTVLRVKVTEQPTGQLTFSVGYSSLEKLVGDIGISETNFRGRGQRVDFEVSMGYLQKRVSLSFTEPRFAGRNMAAGFDLYTYNYNYQTTAAFSSSSTGVTLRTGFPINEYTMAGVFYSIHTDKVSLPTYVLNPASGICATGYSQTLCDEVGRTFTSSVGYTVRLDRRNDPIIPTRGFYIDGRQEFAGLGGVRYIKTTADAAWFYGFTPAWILSVKGQAGYITGWGGTAVRINDRFFEGGDSFRGFQIAGIGPRDTTLQSQGCISGSSTSVPTNPNGTCYGDSLGAKAFAIGTVELQFPNLIPAQYGIKTALFTDFGTAGVVDPASKRNPNGTLNPFIKDEMAFRASVGISVFWKSPMGPLRFDFSKVLKKTPYDVPETFYFSTATNFQ